MRTSDRGLDLIKEFEGLELTPYKDPVGIWTVGWGHTGDVGRDPITEEEAEELLLADVDLCEILLRRYVAVPLNQNQWDALISFLFNVGPGRKGGKSGLLELKGGGQSTLLRCLNLAYYVGAAEQFERWVYAGGKKLGGLVRRRRAERSLFEEPCDTMVI